MLKLHNLLMGTDRNGACGLTSTQRLVLMAVESFISNWHDKIAVADLAALTGLSRDTVRRASRVLVAKGLISKESCFYDDGGRCASRFTLTV